MASYVPERIGKMLPDIDTIYGEYIQAANQAVLKGEDFKCSSYSSVLKTKVEITLTSFQIGNSDTTWSIMIASTEQYIMREVNAMTRFTIVLAAIALIVSVVIVYFILGATTKPILNVTDTLMDISQGEGDLTKRITVDEVLERFGAIDTGVKTVSEHEQNILNAMEEQEVGGRQILESIGRLHRTPIAIFTSSDDPKDIQKARDMGAVDFIKKPLRKEDMLERVGHLVKK